MTWKYSVFLAFTVFSASLSGGCAARGSYLLSAGWIFVMVIWQLLLHGEVIRYTRENNELA